MAMTMEELITKLNEASDAYYNTGSELMSNLEWDAMYDKLAELEKESGIILPNSPTQRAGYKVVSELKEVVHEYPALSLAKTKDISLFPKVFEKSPSQKALVMWKEDGGTVVATYNHGKLEQLATRGNGEVGSDITHNAPYIKGLPQTIPFEGKLVVRGEAIMSYEEFDRLAKLYPEKDYANARNLANATIQMFDSKEMSEREIWFQCFKLVFMEETATQDVPKYMEQQFELLSSFKFNIVEYEVTDIAFLIEVLEAFSNRVQEYPFPVDGLVVAANDAVYADSLPGTGHNPNVLVGYALKWEDECVETVLRDIEWSASRTGLLNPVAIFDPVDLEGTTVSRASLHNVSYILDKNLQVGDRITVYKANKIIPQVAENIDMERHAKILPGSIKGVKTCPVCGGETEVVRSTNQGNVTLTLVCKNPDCAAKKLGMFVHFCERDCMNIKGLSEATLEKFINAGFLHDLADIYNLDLHQKEIEAMEGFGPKSYEALWKAIQKSAQDVKFVPFIHALGIPNVGKGQAKLFAKVYPTVQDFFNAMCSDVDFTFIEGIGPVINQSLHDWAEVHLDVYSDKCMNDIESLMMQITLAEIEDSGQEATIGTSLEGKTFVITGSVNHFANRDELKDKIESLGGKATGSVTSKTDYLINNDVESTSGKNKKAKELGVPIISEEDFLKMIE